MNTDQTPPSTRHGRNVGDGNDFGDFPPEDYSELDVPKLVHLGEDPDESEEDPLPTLADMYGYDNDEDNEEAAFDDVLKAQERCDW